MLQWHAILLAVHFDRAFSCIRINIYFTFRMTTHSQSEIQQLQAQLTSKQKQFEGLNRDLARKDASLSQSEEQRSALHHDLELVRRRNEELQGELSKAHQQLAKMEASMTKATSTVKLLKKVCIKYSRVDYYRYVNVVCLLQYNLYIILL